MFEDELEKERKRLEQQREVNRILTHERDLLVAFLEKKRLYYEFCEWRDQLQEEEDEPL